MRFMIFSKDKANSLSVRQANREAHLKFIKDDTAVDVLMAGPWLDEKGDMAGSLLVVDCDSRAALEGWMARDPYDAAGLPAEVTIKPFIWAINPSH